MEIKLEGSFFPQVSCSLLMADMQITVERLDAKSVVRILDQMTGRSCEVICTHAQSAAIIALAIAGDVFTSELNRLLYDCVGSEIDALPQSLRPIP